MSRSKQLKQGTCHTRAHSLSEINKGKKKYFVFSRRKITIDVVVIVIKMSLQANVNIEAVANAYQSEPYIMISNGLYHLIIDAVFMYLCDDLASALIDLMCYYYVFNTEYPKSMYSLYIIFLQHFVLGLKDNSKLPTAVISLCSSL